MAATPPSPPPPPTASTTDRPTSGQDRGNNPYRLVGLILLFTPLIPGIALFAIVALIFGEEILESNGEATLLGLVIIFVPNIVGAIITMLAKPLHQRFPLTVRGIAKGAMGLGLICLLIATLSLMDVINGTEPGDANIGAGVLAVLGVMAFGLGSVGLLANASRNQHPTR